MACLPITTKKVSSKELPNLKVGIAYFRAVGSGEQRIRSRGGPRLVLMLTGSGPVGAVLACSCHLYRLRNEAKVSLRLSVIAAVEWCVSA
jgi:hypothetical protein